MSFLHAGRASLMKCPATNTNTVRIPTPSRTLAMIFRVRCVIRSPDGGFGLGVRPLSNAPPRSLWLRRSARCAGNTFLMREFTFAELFVSDRGFSHSRSHRSLLQTTVLAFSARCESPRVRPGCASAPLPSRRADRRCEVTLTYALGLPEVVNDISRISDRSFHPMRLQKACASTLSARTIR